MPGRLASALLLCTVLSPGTAWADSHAVTVVNSGTDTIRRIEIGTADNRLRSQLPPGAQARIIYSTGCQAEVRLGFDGSRTEAFPAVDVCSDPRIVTGQGVAAGTAPSPAAGPISKPLTTMKPTTIASTTPVKAPPPIVPPWTGKSITKRFGGMD